MKLVHWPLVGGLLHLVYSEQGTERGRSPPRPLLAVPKVTVHPSTASVPITVLLYSDPLLCGFNVSIKGLTRRVGSLWCYAETAGSPAGSLALCALPYETGSCQNTHIRYYYDVDDGTCKQFNYSGCLGNDNNFFNFVDCMAVCGGFSDRPSSMSLFFLLLLSLREFAA